MPRKAKIAITIDRRLLAQIERIRAGTGESRSAVVGRAVARLTSEDMYQARVRRYVAAYREQPATHSNQTDHVERRYGGHFGMGGPLPLNRARS
jgi:hypothetical protein